MADPFLGEMRMFGGSFAPSGWALASGQLMQISQNEALFSLYGTTYGGDGNTTFGLPDMRGRVPIHDGQGVGLSPYTLGQSGGQEGVKLLPPNLPAHTHTFSASTAQAGSNTVTGNVLAAPKDVSIYVQDAPSAQMGPDTIKAAAGSGQPHENRMPSMALTFLVALAGIFPSRT